jgi:hypothetical protein
VPADGAKHRAFREDNGSKITDHAHVTAAFFLRPSVRNKGFSARMGRGLVAAWLLLSLPACMLMVAERNQTTDGWLVSGNYRAIAEAAEARMGLVAGTPQGRPLVQPRERQVLDHLDAAEAWRLAGDLHRAIAHYDAAERGLRVVEEEGRGAAAVRQTGAVLFGDGSLPYLPSPAEGVLINYYKALAFLQAGDADNARVELNRSHERTQRAVARYEREIAEAAREARHTRVPTVETAAVMRQHFPEMLQWEPYESFILPSATYLQALLLGLANSGTDREQARNLMQRVAAITRNPVVLEDYARLNRGVLCPERNCVWVIAEYGLGPELVERRFDLPVATEQGVVILSMAMPALQSRLRQTAPPFTLLQSSRQPVPFSTLATMDTVVQTEYQKRFPAIMLRSFAGAVLKAAAQQEAYQRGGPVAGLLTNLLSVATTHADIRMWRAMPGVFAVAHLELPRGAEGQEMEPLWLRSAHGEQAIAWDGQGSMLIHIKQVDASVPPVVTILTQLEELWT